MKDTKIEWADHTINFWWGCSKVSPACANCYAETMAKRLGRKVFGQHVEWGAGKPRAERLEKARKEALAVQRGAAKFAAEHGRRPRVFVNSMSDWLDGEVPLEWLAFLLETLHLCPAVDFMLLTKRPENWYHLLSLANLENSSMVDSWLDCRDMPERGVIPANVWIGTTIENQETADARIPALLDIPARVRFLSCEPLLGPVDFRSIPALMQAFNRSPYGWHNWLRRKLHWVIAGGESGPAARPSHPKWFYGLRDECQAAGVPFFFKQWGEWLPCGAEALFRARTGRLKGEGRFKHALAVFSPGRFGDTADMIRVGKEAAGRSLQGFEWNEFPKVEGGEA